MALVLAKRACKSFGRQGALIKNGIGFSLSFVQLTRFEAQFGMGDVNWKIEQVGSLS